MCGKGDLISTESSRENALRVFEMLYHLRERGGLEADGRTSHGIGTSFNHPTDFYKKIFQEEDALQEQSANKSVNMDFTDGEFAVGHFMLPRDPEARAKALAIIDEQLAAAGIESDKMIVRNTPVDNSDLAALAKANEPDMVQYFISREHTDSQDRLDLEKKLMRAYIMTEIEGFKQDVEGDLRNLSVQSLSTRQITYKGLVRPDQVYDNNDFETKGSYFEDFMDDEFKVKWGRVQHRKATNSPVGAANTHPYMMLSHNGEFNNIETITQFMETFMREVLDIDVDIPREFSDTKRIDLFLGMLAILDQFPDVERVELMEGTDVGVELRKIMRPNYWDNDKIGDDAKNFCRMWDSILPTGVGPAFVSAYDPIRDKFYFVNDHSGDRDSPIEVFENPDTGERTIVFASEMGTVPSLPVGWKKRTDQLGKGEMWEIDPENGEITEDREMFEQILAREKGNGRDYSELSESLVVLKPSYEKDELVTEGDFKTLYDRMRAVGVDESMLNSVVKPSIDDGLDDVAAMNPNVTEPQTAKNARGWVSTYLKEPGAQVSNRAGDPLNEPDLFDDRMILGKNRLIAGEDPTPLVETTAVMPPGAYDAMLKDTRLEGTIAVLDATYDIREGLEGKKASIESLRQQALDAIASGADKIVLSDRKMGAFKVAHDPTLLGADIVEHIANHVGDSGQQKGESLAADVVLDTSKFLTAHDAYAALALGISAVNPYMFYNYCANYGRGHDEIGEAEALENGYNRMRNGLIDSLGRFGLYTAVAARGSKAVYSEGLDVSDEYVGHALRGVKSPFGGHGLRELCQNEMAHHIAAVMVHDPSKLTEIGPLAAAGDQPKGDFWRQVEQLTGEVLTLTYNDESEVEAQLEKVGGSVNTELFRSGFLDRKMGGTESYWSGWVSQYATAFADNNKADELLRSQISTFFRERAQGNYPDDAIETFLAGEDESVIAQLDQDDGRGLASARKGYSIPDNVKRRVEEMLERPNVGYDELGRGVRLAAYGLLESIKVEGEQRIATFIEEQDESIRETLSKIFDSEAPLDNPKMDELDPAVAEGVSDIITDNASERAAKIDDFVTRQNPLLREKVRQILEEPEAPRWHMDYEAKLALDVFAANHAQFEAGDIDAFLEQNNVPEHMQDMARYLIENPEHLWTLDLRHRSEIPPTKRYFGNRRYPPELIDLHHEPASLRVLNQKHDAYCQENPRRGEDLYEVASDKPAVDRADMGLKTSDYVSDCHSIAGMSEGSVKRGPHQEISVVARAVSTHHDAGEGNINQDRLPGGPSEEAAATPQVASARFVSAESLVAQWELVEKDDGTHKVVIVIKGSQGAKDGKGGYKKGITVKENEAQNRGAMIGTDLVSMPTQPPFYSIEGIKRQLDALKMDVYKYARDNGYELEQIDPEIEARYKIVANPMMNEAIACGLAESGITKIVVGDGTGGTGASKMNDVLSTGGNALLNGWLIHNALERKGYRDRVELVSSSAVLSTIDAARKAHAFGYDGIEHGKRSLERVSGCKAAGTCFAKSKTSGGCPANIMVEEGRHNMPRRQGEREIAYFADGVLNEVAELGYQHVKYGEEGTICGKAHELLKLRSKDELDELAVRGNYQALEDLLDISIEKDPEFAEQRKLFDPNHPDNEGKSEPGGKEIPDLETIKAMKGIMKAGDAVGSPRMTAADLADNRVVMDAQGVSPNSTGVGGDVSAAFHANTWGPQARLEKVTRGVNLGKSPVSGDWKLLAERLRDVTQQTFEILFHKKMGLAKRPCRFVTMECRGTMLLLGRQMVLCNIFRMVQTRFTASNGSGGVVVLSPGEEFSEDYVPHENLITTDGIGYGSNAGFLAINGGIGRRGLISAGGNNVFCLNGDPQDYMAQFARRANGVIIPNDIDNWGSMPFTQFGGVAAVYDPDGKLDLAHTAGSDIVKMSDLEKHANKIGLAESFKQTTRDILMGFNYYVIKSQPNVMPQRTMDIADNMEQEIENFSFVVPARLAQELKKDELDMEALTQIRQDIVDSVRGTGEIEPFMAGIKNEIAAMSRGSTSLQRA